MLHPKFQLIYEFHSYVLFVAVGQSAFFNIAAFHRGLCAGKFRNLKYDFSGGNRELLASTAVLATVLQYVTPFLACLVLFSFASATLLKAGSILTHATFSKAVQGHPGTPWAQVCF
jgi:hypothetical protein